MSSRSTLQPPTPQQIGETIELSWALEDTVGEVKTALQSVVDAQAQENAPPPENN